MSQPAEAYEIPDVPPPPSTLPVPEEEELALAEFERDPRGHIRRLQDSGHAVVLTEEGGAAAVLLDPAVYDRLLRAIEEADDKIGSLRGMLSCERGEGIPAEDLFRELREEAAAQRRSA